MKKWYTVLIISLIAFCFFLYMNGPCELIIHTTGKDLTSIMLYGIEIIGFIIPWYVVSILVILSLAVFILALCRILTESTHRMRWMVLLVSLVPLFAMLYEAFDKQYVCEINPPIIFVDPEPTVKVIDTYTFVSVNEQKNEIWLYVSKNGELLTVKAPPVCIKPLNALVTKKTNVCFFIRENNLLGIRYLDAILLFGLRNDKSHIFYRSRMQPFPDFSSNNVNDFFKSIPYVILPRPTPTPAPTPAPSN